MLAKPETLLGRGAWAQERCLEVWCPVSLGCLSSHPDSGCFLAVHVLLSQGGLQRGGPWEVIGLVGWCLLSPSDFSQIIPFGGNSLVSCSLPGFPAIRELSPVVSILPGQGGWFQSVCFPNRLLAHCRNRRTMNSVMIFMPLGQGGYPTFKP